MSFGSRPFGRAPLASSETNYDTGGGGGGGTGSASNLLLMGVGSIWWIAIVVGFGSAVNMLLLGVG